jgi:hypothetical protein
LALVKQASQKPVPLDLRLAQALHTWRQHSTYQADDDWVFASRAARGRKPYWGQSLIRVESMSASSSGQFGTVLKLKHHHTLIEAQTEIGKVPSGQRQ